MTRILSAFAVMLLTGSASANLITNGSFETPVVPVGGFINYPGGSIAISGWRVVGVDSAVVSGSFNQSGITFQAQHDFQWIDLAGVTSNSMSSGVTQDISTTIGTIYNIAFHVGSATDGRLFFPSTIDLKINTGPRVSFTNPIAPNNMLNWQQFNVPFVATSSTTTLTFFNGSASNNFLSALDNVSVDAVIATPEPASMALLGLASLGGIGLRWRRNRKALAA